VSIEQASLAVPEEERARFLQLARLLQARAQERKLSQVEFQLSLGVLRVLCGGVAGAVSRMSQ
jgi:hypothetical protein